RQMDDINTIYECDDGLKACELYPAKLPDWVLMDIEMKKMDGLKATEKIKRSYPQAKVIIVSQYDELFYRRLAQKIGAFAYILKEDLYQIPEVINTYNKKISNSKITH
ncbi:MAG: response regulator transcription factor, partial [Calditrichia bacterium]|nr:response regulator transcription factor [Calditrichia bacterium]